MTHAGHGTRVCEYGVVHSRCRCPSKAIVRTPCPTPRECAEKTGGLPGKPYQPRHRKDVVDESEAPRGM